MLMEAFQRQTVKGHCLVILLAPTYVFTTSIFTIVAIIWIFHQGH